MATKYVRAAIGPRIGDQPFSASVLEGDPVYWDSGNSVWEQADATDETKLPRFICVGVNHHGATPYGTLALGALIEDTDAPFTVDTVQYLSETEGAYTETRPTTAGSVAVELGRSISTSLIAIMVNPSSVSAAGYIENGTAAAPSIAFESDPDTGIFRQAADTLGVSLGGTERLRYSAAAFAFQEATVISTSAGNLSLNAPSGSTVRLTVNSTLHLAADSNFIDIYANSGLRLRGTTRELGTSGGGLTITTDSAGLTLSPNTGLVTVSAGATPASVATATGTASSGSITATGGLGGNTTIATTGTGGVGGGFSFTGGAGGVASAAATAATGGAGGAWAVTTGAGGAEAVATVTSTGGAGGAVTITTGAGGAVSAAVSGTATGGAAGLLTVRGGVGGAVTATSGTNVGGAGGGVSIIAGAGGAASGATDTGGAGGVITLTPGAGGSGDANADGAPGYISITTGITKRSVQTIAMGDAAVTLTLVPGTPAGTLMTSDVLYVDAESSTNEDLLLPPEADWVGGILIIVNTGGETINIENDAGGSILTLETLNTAIVVNDGTTLRGLVGVP